MTQSSYRILPYTPSMQPLIEDFCKECFDALGWTYEPLGRHGDLVNIEKAYMSQGCFWCMIVDESLVGIVAVHPLDEHHIAAEMKRLYISPRHQGLGYGGVLFDLAIQYAIDEGYQCIRVDTRRDRAAALRLIEKYGFAEIEKYNNNGFSELYFELQLCK